MKTLTKIALALVLLATTALNTPAGPVRGYVRSNGTYVAPHYRSDSGSLGGNARSTYVYRNPYAASPSVCVGGYTRSNGTYVAPHVRTPANETVTDNLSYRGNGTIRAAVLSGGRKRDRKAEHKSHENIPSLSRGRVHRGRGFGLFKRCSSNR